MIVPSFTHAQLESLFYFISTTHYLLIVRAYNMLSIPLNVYGFSNLQTMQIYQKTHCVFDNLASGIAIWWFGNHMVDGVSISMIAFNKDAWMAVVEVNSVPLISLNAITQAHL